MPSNENDAPNPHRITEPIFPAVPPPPSAKARRAKREEEKAKEAEACFAEVQSVLARYGARLVPWRKEDPFAGVTWGYQVEVP